MKKLSMEFYLRPQVVNIARDLLGKILVTNFGGQTTSGRIVETEAYEGETDRASHASKGRTQRTGVMYEEGGRAYVYLCYGIHQMFNVVTNSKGTPHAVLIRAVEPMTGLELMLERTGKKRVDESLTSGPGKLGKAFGFHTAQCGLSLQGDDVYIADDGFEVSQNDIVASPRIGVDYAGAHAEWLYRFYLKNNPYVSALKKGKQSKSKEQEDGFLETLS